MSRPEFPQTSSSAANVRPSYGLKDLLWLVGDRANGCLLDLGPAWQSTLTFFLDRGFRVCAEDLLPEWNQFQARQEAAAGELEPSGASAPLDPKWLAASFLEEAVQFSGESVDAALAWSIFDYASDELAAALAERLYDILRPGGCILAIFHSQPPKSCQRYRIASGGIEVLPGAGPAHFSRVFQNREILQLFGKFRSAKTYVGRDQIREGLFIK
jgi:hypothetical protein